MSSIKSMSESYIEVELMRELHVADTLAAVVAEALNRGFEVEELRTDPVVIGTVWKSKEESTVQKPILYLTEEGRPTKLILEGPQDKKYRMFEYIWVG